MIWTGAAVKNIFLAGVAIITTLAAGPVRAADESGTTTATGHGLQLDRMVCRSERRRWLWPKPMVNVLETFNGHSFFSGNW